jgi:hypothetical protein
METKGATQVQLRPPAISATHTSSHLQRTCACGQHTMAGGECEECRKNHEALAGRAGVVPLPAPSTPSSVAQSNQAEQEQAASPVSNESRFAYDFSQVPVRTTPVSNERLRTDFGGETLSTMLPSLASAAGPAGGIQAKYEVAQPGDAYEQEADQVASQLALLAKPQTDTPDQPQKTQLPPPSPDDNAALNVLKRSPGQPLSAGVRKRVEPFFGVDLSTVRVHTDAPAGQAASILHAKAFTSQNHIWLGANQSPESVELMTHEATHVVQQTARPASQRAIQRKVDDLEQVEDGEEVKQKMQRRIRQAVKQAEQQSPDKPQPDPAKIAEVGSNQQVVTGPADAQQTARKLDPAAVEEKARELQPDATPPVDRQAEVQPKVEQATQQVKEKSEQPPEPQPAQTKAPETATRSSSGKGAALGDSAVDEAEKAVQRADTALVSTGVPDLPTPPVADASALVAPPVDAKGEPLPTDPAMDAQVADLAQQAQTLREEGQQLRAAAAQEKGNAHVLRGNIALMHKNIGQAEQAVETSVDHLSFRRDTLGKAQEALKVSNQKAEMVEKEAPGYVTKADKVQERSGPMARDATKLAAENKSKASDDPKGSAKSREQGEKLGKVGSDTVTVNEAVTQTKERAGTLVQDAAKAKQMNTATRAKVETMQDTLQKSDERLTQMKEQNKQARSEIEEANEQPDAMASQAVSLDKQGESLISAASTIEQQLQQSQMSYMQSMQRVPGTEEPQGEAVPPDQVEASPSSENVPEETSSAQPSETKNISQEQTTLSEQPTGNENISQEQSGTTSPSPGQQAEIVSQVPEQTRSPVQEGQQGPQEQVATGQQSPEAVGYGYSQRAHVDLAGKLPSWATGEEAPSEKERAKEQQENEQQRKDDLAKINEIAGGNFKSLTAGQKTRIALQLAGQKLFRSISKTQWPGWGKLAKGLIDPRGPLTGVLSGLSMILSAGANIFSKEQWVRDPIGNVLKSAADIATGLTIIFGSITALAGLIIAIATAATILTFGAAAPITGPIIAFCATVLTTVGGWTIYTGLIALGLQEMVFIKNLIEAATAKNAEELESRSNDMKEDVSNAGNVLLQIGMAKLGQIGGKALSAEIKAAGSGAAFARTLPGKFAQGVKTLPGRVVRTAKALPGRVVRGAKGGIGRIKGFVRSLGREGEAEAGALATRGATKLGTEAEQIASLGKMTRETETMLENNPSLREALTENPRAANALKLCKSYCFPENATPAQIKRLNDLLERAEKTGVKVDMSDVKEFLYKNRADLDDAINALNDRFAEPGLSAQGAKEAKGVVETETPEPTKPSKGTKEGDDWRYRRYKDAGGKLSKEEWLPLSRGGRGGGPEHEAIRKELLQRRGARPEVEKGGRYSDAHWPSGGENGKPVNHQIGDVNEVRGDPINRERQAIEDIRKAVGDKEDIWFWDKKKGPNGPPMKNPDKQPGWIPAER